MRTRATPGSWRTAASTSRDISCQERAKAVRRRSQSRADSSTVAIGAIAHNRPRTSSLRPGRHSTPMNAAHPSPPTVPAWAVTQV